MGPGDEIPQALEALGVHPHLLNAQEIVSELERRGHRTIWFEDRPGVDTFTKAMVRRIG